MRINTCNGNTAGGNSCCIIDFYGTYAYHLLKNNIITKQPQTVEVLGSATVICVDKTGTITENKMDAAEIYDFRKKIKPETF